MQNIIGEIYFVLILLFGLSLLVKNLNLGLRYTSPSIPKLAFKNVLMLNA